MTNHLHCQECGTHFPNQADLDSHNRREHGHETHDGLRGKTPVDAQANVQERPAGREGRKFTRTHKE